MNKNRRTEIDKLVAELEGIQSALSDLATEERDAFDNMPESLQNSDRGQASSNAADELESADSTLADVINSLNAAAQS